MRSTWDDVFPLKKLYALDVRVNSVDPAWPIKPLPPTVNASIHVNPKFLKQVCMSCIRTGLSFAQGVCFSVCSKLQSYLELRGKQNPSLQRDQLSLK